MDAILKRSEILRSDGVKIDIEHVVYGLRDVALHLHNTGDSPSHRDLRHIEEQLERSGATQNSRMLGKQLIQMVGARGFEPLTSTV